MKNKPIKCGLKFYVLAESETGYIHHAVLHFSTGDPQDKDVESELGLKTFDLVCDLLAGVGLNDGISFLDQGYTVSVSTIFTVISPAIV